MNLEGKARGGRLGRARGLMLMECLVYLAVWMVVASVGFALFYQVYTQSKHLSRSAEDLTRVIQAGEQWRGEVRQAVSTPRYQVLGEGPGWEFQLARPGESVTYRFTGTNVLRRTDVQPDWREVVPRVKASTLHCDRWRQGNSWRWELELQARSRRPALQPRFTFQAVPPPEGNE